MDMRMHLVRIKKYCQGQWNKELAKIEISDWEGMKWIWNAPGKNWKILQGNNEIESW
jgi:hypothetical protein